MAGSAAQELIEEYEMAVDHNIIILGAGFAGLGLGARLKQEGIDDFIILEQADDIGGTWRDNIYPGSACDVESHLYCYDFDLHLGTDRIYARQPELLAYIKRMADNARLGGHIRCNAHVVAAQWDDAACKWRITLADGEILTAQIFVPAWGQLNRPAIPDFPGRETFAGLAFHSARWPRDLKLDGKRVASIGNAASAIQYIPEIAPVCGHLTIFQRTPNWVVPRGDRVYTPEEMALFANPKDYRQDKDRLFAWRESAFEKMVPGSADSDELVHMAQAHLAAQVPDPVLRAKLAPDYPLGCKRILRSDDYYPTLMRDNVTLETTAINRIEPHAIVTADGMRHEVDVIIYGTGFETQSFQGGVDIHGAGGQALRETWKNGAFAYLGMSVPGFPNFFLLYGPNTNLGHNSILLMLEAQFTYIIGAIRDLSARPECAIDVRAEVARQFDDGLQGQFQGTAWSGSCTSWYKNASGRIVNNWSGTVGAYQRIATQFNADDYSYLSAQEAIENG